MSPLTHAQSNQFQREGFVVIDNLLTSGQVQKVLNAMERIYQGERTFDRRPPDDQKPFKRFSENGDEVKHLVHARLLDQDYWDVVTDSRIGKFAARLLETSSVSLIEDQMLEKPAGGRPFALHQDYAYWHFSTSTQMVTCWIALMDMTIQMAPIQFVKGSHKWGEAPKPKCLTNGNMSTMMESVEKIRPPASGLEIVTALVPKGGCTFHHSLTVHGSSCNTSNQHRSSISLHFAGAECRTNLKFKTWSDYMWTGIESGDPLVNEYMPVVYSE